MSEDCWNRSWVLPRTVFFSAHTLIYSCTPSFQRLTLQDWKFPRISTLSHRTTVAFSPNTPSLLATAFLPQSQNRRVCSQGKFNPSCPIPCPAQLVLLLHLSLSEISASISNPTFRTHSPPWASRPPLPWVSSHHPSDLCVLFRHHYWLLDSTPSMEWHPVSFLQFQPLHQPKQLLDLCLQLWFSFWKGYLFVACPQTDGT